MCLCPETPTTRVDWRRPRDVGLTVQVHSNENVQGVMGSFTGGLGGLVGPVVVTCVLRKPKGFHVSFRTIEERGPTESKVPKALDTRVDTQDRSTSRDVLDFPPSSYPNTPYRPDAEIYVVTPLK